MAESSSNDEIPQEIVNLMDLHEEQLGAELFSDAEESLNQLWEYASEHVIELVEADPEFQESMLATAYESQGKWAAAQRIYENRRARIASDDCFELASRYKDLAKLHICLDEFNLASFYYAQSVYWLRQSDPYEIVIASWQLGSGRLANDHGRYADALVALNEAYSNLSEKRSFDGLRALVLTLRARSFLALGNDAAAEADHSDAWALLAPRDGWSSSTFGLANWWHVGGLIWQQQGNTEEAAHCWERSIEYFRQIIETDSDHAMQLALSRALVEFGQFLLRHGNPTEAAEQFAESDQIRTQFNLAPLDHP